MGSTITKNFCNASEIDWSLVYSSSDVSVAVSHFNSKLREPIDNHAPFIEKRVKGRKCKWLNAEIKSEMNRCDQLHRKAQESRKEKDWTIYKKQCNRCTNQIKKAKASYHQNSIEENATNPKKFWNCIKYEFPLKLSHIQTCTSINLNSIIKTFSDYFSIAVKKLKSFIYPLEKFMWQYIMNVS